MSVTRIQACRSVLLKYPDIFLALKKYFHYVDCNESINELIEQLCSKTDPILLIQTIQNVIIRENFDFKIRFDVCKTFGGLQITPPDIGKKCRYSSADSLTEKNYRLNKEYMSLLKANNPNLMQYESFACRNVQNFIDLILVEAKYSSLLLMANDAHKVFYHKYFRHVSGRELYSIFSCLYSSLEDDRRRQTQFAVIFHNFAVVIEKFKVAERVMRFLLSRYINCDDAESRIFACHALLGLIRIRSHLSTESRQIVDNDRLMYSGDSVASHSCIFEYRFMTTIADNKSNDKEPPDTISFLKQLQFHRNPLFIHNVLKEICKYHNICSLFDTDFQWRLSLYLVQFTTVHLEHYSSYFCASLKVFIKVLMQLRMPSRKLADKLLGLCEMLYYSPSKMVASANLLLARSIGQECLLSPDGDWSKEYDLMYQYSTACFRMSAQLKYCRRLKIRSLLFLLQIMQKVTTDGRLTDAYRDAFNEACLLISDLGETDSEKCELYRRQLQLIDGLVTAVHREYAFPIIDHADCRRRTTEGLSSDQLRLLRATDCQPDNSYADRKMCAFCRVAPVVGFISGTLPMSSSSSQQYPLLATPIDIDYNRLLQKPDPSVFYEYDLWPRPSQRSRTASSGTEDSESDSLSDCSLP